MPSYAYTQNIKVYDGIPFSFVIRKAGYYDIRQTKVGTIGMYGQNFQSYSGLTLASEQITGSIMTVSITGGALPNGSTTGNVLGCLATAGQSYEVETSSSTYGNYTVVGTPTINTSTGVVSGFSNSSYLVLPQSFPANVKFTAIFNITFKRNIYNSDGQCLFTSNTANKTVYVNHTSSKLSIYDGGSVGAEGLTALTDGSKYWVGIDYDYSTMGFKLYLLADDGTYVTNTLPSFSSWNLEIDTTLSADIFSNTLYRIGSNPVNNFIWRGDVNLAGCQIKINNNLWWLPRIDLLAIGLLPNGVTDDGTEKTWNLFYDSGVFLLDTAATKQGYSWCGTINIPAHTV